MRTAPDFWTVATRGLFALLLALVLYTFGDYGMSWDQYYRQAEGQKKLVYYQNLFAGHWQRYDNPEDNYPGVYDLTLQVVNKLQPCGPGVLGLIMTDHLLTALAGLLTIAAAYKIAKKLGGPRAGFFAALFLALFPHFWGHMFINPKDIPFACGYLWSLYFTLKLLDAPLNARLIGELILAYGLTLGVRMGGVFLFAFMALALIMRAFLQRRQGPVGPRLFRYALLTLLVVVGSFVVLLPFWPFAHPDPVGTIWRTLTRVASYPWNGPVLLNGHVYPSTALPWYYLPEMLAITAPTFLLILGILGLFLALVSLAKKGVKEDWNYLTVNRLSIFFLAFALAFPVFIVILKHATLYDGIRHFLFILGPWAILAALTLEKILAHLQTSSQFKANPLVRASPQVIYGILVLLTAAIFMEGVKMHPYQYVFYNSLAGGTSKIWANFETDYWGTSHREAVELLAKHLENQKDRKIYTVSSPMAPWLTENFLPPNLRYVSDPRQADFFVSFLRFNAHMWSDGEIMEDCIVQRQGVPLAIVRDRRAIVKAQAAGLPRAQSSVKVLSGLLDMIPAFL